MDVLVIGCGLTGSVIAHHLAEQGKQITIWDRRDHIGGNMYDYKDQNGIMVHRYGPHVFHTYTQKLMDYMQRYGSWTDFPITCQVYMLGKFTPSPFNYQTIDDYYSPENAAALKAALEQEYPGRDKATIVELLASRNPLVKEYADFLFRHDYSLYTAKQWGLQPSQIDPSVLKRVPVLFSYKNGYFDDTWQKVPVDGYTAWFEQLLNHPNITVCLNQEAKDHLRIENDQILMDGNPFEKPVVYTGPLDELLDQRYGSLPYRSLRFEWKTEEAPRYQGAPLVAYPEAEGFTRITEYAHFPQQEEHTVTSLAYEYPVSYTSGQTVEPYYPILNEDSIRAHAQYLKDAGKIPNLICCGRLADFKYYNMDQALARALAVCEDFFNRI